MTTEKAKTKSKRLTKALKHSIKNAAEDWKFKKEDVAVPKMELGLAEELYEHYYGHLKDVMANLPYFMIRSDKSSGFCLDDDITDPLIEAGLIPNISWYRNIWVSFGNNEEIDLLSHFIDAETFAELKQTNKKLHSKLEKYIVAYVSLHARKIEFKEKLTALMEGLTTTKKLVDILPEAQAWLPEVYECNDLPNADQVAGLLKV